MWNLANILTVSRLALLPIIIFFMFFPYSWAAYLCLILYTIGAITDYLDGWIARKYNQITEFGTFLDPISDKIYVITIMIMLVATQRITGIFVIFVIIILTREFVVSGLREYLGAKNIKVPVSKLAKWKTAVQMLATGLLIISPYITGGIAFGLFCLAGACTLTVITGWDYLKTGLKYMNGNAADD